MTELFTSVVSITATKRRRYLWAAWWTAPPAEDPFRKPDASSGGARSREEAKKAAEAAAGRPLVETEPRWAAAWGRVLRGAPPWPSRANPERLAAPPPPVREGTVPWAYGILGIQKGATLPEVRRAFRLLALEAHPDRGGTEAAFIAAKRAYDVALASVTRAGKPRRR
jgi:hypothetical protein